MEVISTSSVSKSFGKTKAVDVLSIKVNEGDIYGFLGLNGAGKTTLIRILLGMVKPDNGEIHLFENLLTADFNHWNDVGYMVETPHAYPNLSVIENLEVYYQLRQLKNPYLLSDIIDKLKLTTFKHTKAKHLSLGNQQRLGLAKALLHRPKLLILDEPINGLDPEGIVEIRNLLKELVSQGTTVFLSSHILGEISKVANRIGIIHEGKLIKELTNQELTAQLIKKIIVKTNNNLQALHHLIHANHQAVLTENNDIEISDEKALSMPENIASLLVEKGIPPKALYLFTEDLEMFFLRTVRH